MSTPYSADLNLMQRAAEKAGRSLARDFGEVERLQVSRKGPGDFVSAADKRSEEIIYNELSKVRPNYAFLMEESGAKGSEDADYRWIIDPLDGTSNFLHGLPQWCISIGLEKRNGPKPEIVAGLIYDPVKDEMFKAEKGGGAFMGRKRIRVSARHDPDTAMVCVGGPRPDKAKKEHYMKEFVAINNYVPVVRRMGAAALDLAYVAAGRFDAFFERNLQPWDIAAGILIVQEAGGFISDMDKDNQYVVNSCNVLASNQAFFDPLKKLVRSV
jgi:myo-inositol-1(or 4)-monophosphatase